MAAEYPARARLAKITVGHYQSPSRLLIPWSTNSVCRGESSCDVGLSNKHESGFILARVLYFVRHYEKLALFFYSRFTPERGR